MSASDLEARIGRLGEVLPAYSDDLRFAVRYIHDDPASSVTKSRLVLERLLLRVYVGETGREPRKAQLGDMLADNQFTRKIERRIVCRMHAIRDLGNLGPHGGTVQPCDAMRVLEDLCEVIDWYVSYQSGNVGRAPKLMLVEDLSAFPKGCVPILFAKHEGRPLGLGEAGDVVDRVLAFEHRLPDGLQLLAINPLAYASFEDLLHDVYTGFLTRRYGLYSYGRDWVLAKGSHYVTLLAVPWMWLREKRARALIDVIPGYPGLRTPLEDYGFAHVGEGRRPVWAVVDRGFENACGLFTLDEAVAQEAFESIMKSFAFTLSNHLALRLGPGCQVRAGAVRKLGELDPDRFPYKLVISPHWPCSADVLGEDAVIVIDHRPSDT
jgi:hypothetical protein